MRAVVLVLHREDKLAVTLFLVDAAGSVNGRRGDSPVKIRGGGGDGGRSVASCKGVEGGSAVTSTERRVGSAGAEARAR